MRIADRLRSKKNVFKTEYVGGPSISSWQSSPRLLNYTRRDSIVSSLFTRMAIDASSTDIKHVLIDPITLNQTVLDSNLQNIFSKEANIDESNISFVYNMVYSLLDEGIVAVVPTDWIEDEYGNVDPCTLRVCRILQFYTHSVLVSVYNENTGQYEQKNLNKKNIAIIESPLYEVLNGPNGTLTRLIKKMSLLDNNDELLSSGNLDLIFQFSQAIKTDSQIDKANERLETMQSQLNDNNRIGAVWIDGTEKFTQLSRPVNDTLPQQVHDLTLQFFNQIGVTENILNGTANETEMRGYYTRTIDPILNRIASEFKRSFLSSEQIKEGQQIIPYRDPFKLVPVSEIAEVADKFRRNMILSANEIRAIVGRGPDPSPESDQLINPNMTANNQITGSTTSPIQNGGIINEEV